jgi:hypothetical protein
MQIKMIFFWIFFENYPFLAGKLHWHCTVYPLAHH